MTRIIVPEANRTIASASTTAAPSVSTDGFPVDGRETLVVITQPGGSITNHAFLVYWYIAAISSWVAHESGGSGGLGTESQMRTYDIPPLATRAYVRTTTAASDNVGYRVGLHGSRETT